jgi:hypothetical protein
MSRASARLRSPFSLPLLALGLACGAAHLQSGRDGGAVTTASPDAPTAPDAVERDGAPSAVCAVGQTRPCYTGAAGTADIGVCRAGTQSCDLTGRWLIGCSGQKVPTAEFCNNLDDDCNGTVDNVPRTLLTEPVPYATLLAKDPDCHAPDIYDWSSCHRAIQLHCRDRGCRTGTTGLVEDNTGSVTLTCVTAEPPLEVAASDLAAFGTCPAGPPYTPFDHFQCLQAVHRYCVQQGFASGFGPVGSPAPGRYTINCLRAGHATPIETTYATLSTLQELCSTHDALTVNPYNCSSASKRLCIARRYVSGYGPVTDGDGTAPVVVCLGP